MITRFFFHLQVVAFAVCIGPNVALGQETVRLAEKQIELNNRVNSILRQTNPDLALARKLAKEALLEGERIDLLLLSLARVEQLDDRCHRATRLLNEIEVAPNDPSVPRKAILKRRDAYSEQMSSLCSGTLDMECADPMTQIRIGPRAYSCDAPIRVSPGIISLTATLGDQSRTMEIELVGHETKRITISLTAPTHTSTRTESNASAQSTSSRAPKDRRTRQFVGLGSALAVLGTAATTYSVVHAKQVQDGVDMGTISIEAGLEQEQRINRMRAIGIPTAILGAATIVYGITAKPHTSASSTSRPQVPRWTTNVGQRSFSVHFNYMW